MTRMYQAEWLGLNIGEWLAIVVLVLVVAAVARYLFVERPRDRKRPEDG